MTLTWFARLGLRARVIALFALGALGLSVALAIATYSVTRSNLADERERSNIRAAQLDKATVENTLKASGSKLDAALALLEPGPLRRPVILTPGENSVLLGTDAQTVEAAITPEMREAVRSGSPSVQRVEIGGGTSVVVGFPLLIENEEFAGATFYEVGTMDDVNDTLRSLGATLTVFAALTTIAGALLGVYASKRLLAPLGSVSRAAQAIGAGDLSARLDPSEDRDLRTITTSFNTMVDQLEARLERDRRFAADVSHELRSPLQTLTAASSVLVRKKDTMDKRTASAAELMADEVTRFADLVQDLLELARDDAPVDITVDANVPALLKDLGRRFVRRGGLDLAAAPGTWPLDVKRFERMISNLLQNAERHGGGAIRLAAEVVDDVLVVDVDDSGPGVPEDERDLIFDRFGRGRAANARGFADGTGLGLSLVKTFAESHGGSVRVLERPGGGARFRVEIPRPKEVSA